MSARIARPLPALVLIVGLGAFVAAAGEPAAAAEGPAVGDRTIGLHVVDQTFEVGVEAPFTAVVELTGLRNPCTQIDGFADGLMRAVLGRDADGNLIRKAGVMSVVLASGLVRSGDRVDVELPVGAHEVLAPV